MLWKMAQLQGTLVNISYRAAHGWVYAGPVALFVDGDELGWVYQAWDVVEGQRHQGQLYAETVYYEAIQ